MYVYHQRITNWIYQPQASKKICISYLTDDKKYDIESLLKQEDIVWNKENHRTHMQYESCYTAMYIYIYKCIIYVPKVFIAGSDSRDKLSLTI